MDRRSVLRGGGALLGAGLLAGGRARAEPASITGAGATFPNPVYQKWAEAARGETGVTVNYQSVGSGAGINQIRNRTVDFGATDAPLGAQPLAESGLLQFPAVMGAVVVVVHIPGLEQEQLRLTGELLAEIYLGRITRWNDPRLVALNPELALPNLAIAPVGRADGSGTTYVWTSYLAAVSEEWKRRVGVGTSVRFPTGAGARGNEGVAGMVRTIRGAIGYVENAYAIGGRLAVTQLRNKAGRFLAPTAESFLAAATPADWEAPGFAVSLIDQPGNEAWPILAPSFVLLPRNPADVERSRAVMRFFDWSFRHGGALAEELDYIPLPLPVQEAVRRAWQAGVTVDGHPVWTT